MLDVDMLGADRRRERGAFWPVSAFTADEGPWFAPPAVSGAAFSESLELPAE